jgi:hypothetical protein
MQEGLTPAGGMNFFRFDMNVSIFYMKIEGGRLERNKKVSPRK